MLLVRLPIFLTFPQIVFLLFGCALAALLCLRSGRETVLLQKYRRTRDDDTELQLLLEERNRSLLGKAEYRNLYCYLARAQPDRPGDP